MGHRDRKKQLTLDSDPYTGLITYSPDERWLAIQAAGKIEIFNALTDQKHHALQTGFQIINALRFTPDSTMLVVAGGEYYSQTPGSEIQFWETSSGQWLGRWDDLHRVPVIQVMFSADGLTMITVSRDGEIKRWQALAVPAVHLTPTPTPTPTLTPTAIPTPSFSEIPLVASLGKGSANVTAWTPDHSRFAVGGSRGVHLYDPTTWQETAFYPSGYVYHVTFSPDGHLMAVIGYEGVAVIEWEQGRILLETEAAASIDQLVFSSDSRAFAYLNASCSARWCDYRIEYWDLGTQQMVHTFQMLSENNRLASPAISPDGTLLAAGGGDGLIYLWDLSTGELLRTLEGHAGNVNSVAFNTTGSRLVSGGADATVRLWNPQTGQRVQTFSGFPNWKNRHCPRAGRGAGPEGAAGADG